METAAAPTPPPQLAPSNVRQMLDLNTGHLPLRLVQDLNGEEGVTAHEMPYGWLMHVPPVDEPGAPAEVRTIWDRARRLGCTYVLFDSDGEYDGQLPYWT